METIENTIELQRILSFLGIEFISHKGRMVCNGHKTAKTIGQIKEIFGREVMTSGISIEVLASTKMFDFKNDWNMLMVIVNKIESLGYSVNQSSSMIYVNGDRGVYVKSVDVGFNVTRIQALYKVCLSFIRTYNQDNEISENDKLIERMLKASGSKYPYQEGDDYYTIENNEIIWSCWDDQSEIFHDEDPNKVYYNSVGEAVEYLKTTDCKETKVYDYGNDNNYFITLHTYGRQ